jgi:MOSC domain-containing protein YiiM
MLHGVAGPVMANTRETFPEGSTLRALFDAPTRPGVVRWIGLRPAHRAPMLVVESAQAEEGRGLLGDRWNGRPSGARQISLIAFEHLAAIGSYLGQGATPARLRRNIVVSGVNLLALKGTRFRLGAALLEYGGECHPCSRMEQEFGPGGYNAVRGHGGIIARVIEGGEIRLGDALSAPKPPPPS